jgi:hypothetical protein
MDELTFLAGKVKKWILPVFEAGTSPGAASLKRLLLPQGELAQFYDSEEGVRFLAFIELRADSLRGNHYHKIKEEWVYMIQGEVSLLLRDIDTQAEDCLSLKAGELAFIPTGIAHALKTVVPGQAIEFSKSRFDPTDTHRFMVT